MISFFPGWLLLLPVKLHLTEKVLSITWWLVMFAYQSYVALLEQKILWWIVKVRVLDGVFCSERKDLIWALLFLLCCEVMLLHRMAQHAFYDWFDASISLLHCSLPVSQGLMQQKSFLWEGQNWNIFVCLLHLIINNYQQLKADHAKYFYVCPCYPFSEATGTSARCSRMLLLYIEFWENLLELCKKGCPFHCML